MNFASVINNSLKTTGTVIGTGSIIISTYHNPLLPLQLFSYYLLSEATANPSTSSLFSKEYGIWVKNIFDPTNALVVTLVKPGIITFFNENSLVHPAKELFLERGTSMMVSAGYYRDITSSNKASHILDNASSAFVKYSSIYTCRKLISEVDVNERNNMCAGVGEGMVMSTKLDLSESRLPLLAATVMIITKVASEWTVYKAADFARVGARGMMEKNSLVIASGFKTDLTTFISEWTYTTVTNFCRWGYKPVIESINKIITPEVSLPSNYIDKEVTISAHNEISPYEERIMESDYTMHNTCLYNEGNIYTELTSTL